ncbi:MAG: TRAP transporter permease, partial [Pseudomonadota bacterium]
MSANEPFRTNAQAASGAVDLAEQPVTREELLSVEAPADDAASPPWLRWAVIAMAVAFGIWHIVTNVYLTEPTRWQNAIHFGGFALLAALVYPTFQSKLRSRKFLFLDLAYGLLVAASALWIAAA